MGSDQKLNNPSVLLLGASSQIGVFAIPRLILAGFNVLAVSRKGKPESYPAFEQVEWLSDTEALKAAHRCEHMLSAGPLELAKKFLVSRPSQLNKMDSGSSPERQTLSPVTAGSTPVTAGSIDVTAGSIDVTAGSTTVTPGLTRGPFQSAVIFSSSSVESKRNSNNPQERQQMKNMLNLESELQLLAENSDTKLVIFRPTLIYGCGLDTNISRLASWIDQFGLMPINRDAAGLRQPVHADDLAYAAVTALLSSTRLPTVLTLTGGETLSYKDMVTKIFLAFDKPVRLLAIPQWLFSIVARILIVFNIDKGINGEMIKRQQIDLIFDDQQARELLNYKPRDFSPTKADFCLPEFNKES